jgi:hypothetical protein
MARSQQMHAITEIVKPINTSCASYTSRTVQRPAAEILMACHPVDSVPLRNAGRITRSVSEDPSGSMQ